MSTVRARDPDTRTCIFWDVEDYPIPDGLDPASVFHNIESAFRNKGYEGEVSIIRAYRGNKLIPDDDRLLDEYNNAGIIFAPEGDEHKRVSSMFVDILFWSLDNKPSNVMVLSKSFPGTTSDTIPCALEDLFIMGYHVLLSEPYSPFYAVYESSLWIYESSYGGKPMDQSGSSKKPRRN